MNRTRPGRRASSVAITSFVAAALSLTSCSSTGGTGAGGAEEASDSGAVTFIVPQGSIRTDAYEAFEEDHPEIALTVQEVPVAAYKQQIRTLTQTGDLPDVISLPGGPDGEALVIAGVPLDLADALDTEAYEGGGSWRDSFNEGVLTQASATFLTQDRYADGEQWFVPQSLLAVAPIYNRDIFDEVGIEPPADWDEFLDNNERLVEAGYTPMSLTGALAPDWWPKMVWDQTAGDVTREQIESGEVDFTDSRLVEALEIVADLHAAGTFPEGGTSNATEEEQALFLGGRTAQFLNTPTVGQYVVENAPFEVGAYVLPGAKGVDPVRPVGGTTSNVVVNKDSDNQEAAILFAKYLTSQGLYESQAENYMLSPLATPVETDDEVYRAYSDAVADGAAVSQTWFQTFDPANYDRLNNEIYPGLFSGRISPEEAGRQISELFGS